MSTIDVAVVQTGPVPFDLPSTLARVRVHAETAATRGARLIVFPEALIGGYPKGEQFGVTVGQRSEAGRAEFRRYFEAAIDVPGPTTEALGNIAKDCGAFLMIGVIERALGTLYCTVLFFAPEGSLMGKHRKVMPTAMERVIWGFGDGSTLPVFSTPVGRIGAVICWENYMPLLRAHMYAQGVQLYCVATVDDRDTWPPTLQHIAIEGRCFVLSACQFVPGADNLDPSAPGRDKPLIRGGSMIVDPFGKIIAGPVYGQETVLTATIDVGRTTEGKFDLDVAGHYARPDIFRLSVDTTAR